MPEDESSPAENGGVSRRRLLEYGGLAALLGLLGVGAGRLLWGDDAGPAALPTSTPTAPPTRTPAPDSPSIVERFAPDLHFGRRERWYPTDPRPYARDGVVDGVEAFTRYHDEFQPGGPPPRPTVFHNVVPLEGSVVALQYWLYSVFDQFAVNFHWHDWELLQVFVDVDADEVVLLSASAHARSVPNNEFLSPDIGSAGRPVVLAEVGSHSSATDVNPNRPSFERRATAGVAADVTNAFLRPADGLVDEPFAYGLPRDEGLPVPYSLPEFEGVPLHEYLGVDLDAFVAQDVTVRSWRGLPRPPSDLPTRESGLTLTPPGSPTAGVATYDLVPLSAAAARIDDFTGPQLSFEFALPGFVEDQFADHLTTAGIPWEDPRSTDPVGDVTDPANRRALTGDAPTGLSDRVVGVVSTLLGRPDGRLDGVDPADRADLEPFVSVSGFPLPVEVACLLRSDPVATVTAGGVFRFLHVDAGPHELVVNGPGFAPYAERFDHGGGVVRPGVGGRITVVPAEDAAVIRGDRRGAGGVSRVRVVESFAGPVFDGRPVEDGRFSVPVHRDGEYLVEVVDDDGVRGVVRVPSPTGEPIDEIETGKVALARRLAEFLLDAAAEATELGGGQTSDREQPIPAEFEVAAGDAREAAAVAADGEAARANDRLVGVVDRLERVRDRLGRGDRGGYAAPPASLLAHRAETGIHLAETAYAAPIVG